jgi:hypothetical protein
LISGSLHSLVPVASIFAGIGEQIHNCDEDVLAVASSKGTPMSPQMFNQVRERDLPASQSPLPVISSNKQKDAAPPVRRLHVLPEKLALQDVFEGCR